jgi:hypothetical protein
MAAFAAKAENMAAERIGPDDLLHLGRQIIEPGAQIDRLTGEKNLRSRRRRVTFLSCADTMCRVIDA